MGGDQHGDAFLHILYLGDKTMTSQTSAIVLGHAIGTDLLLEALYLFQVLFVFLLDVSYVVFVQRTQIKVGIMVGSSSFFYSLLCND